MSKRQTNVARAGTQPGSDLDSLPADLLNPQVNQIEEYTPIAPLEVLSERLDIPVERLVKLDANENPYGPLPAVVRALADYSFLHIYPDPESSALRRALSDFVGVPAGNIVAGQGADELLDYLCRLFLSPGDAVINSPPTFGMYSFDARLQGAEVIDVPRRADYAIDTAAVSQAVTRRVSGGSGVEGAGPAKLVFATSPNNPTGNWLADEDLRELLALPVMVVLDEAYVEFADHPSRANWALVHDNLVVLRTFSKAAGIAGLRLGYGVFPDWLLPILWKYKQPYNVNVAAQVAGVASLAHANDMQTTVNALKGERERLYGVLAEIEYLDPVAGSQANFVLCHVRGRGRSDLERGLGRRGRVGSPLCEAGTRQLCSHFGGPPGAH